MNERGITIVGGGLVGALLATLLAQRGFAVDLHRGLMPVALVAAMGAAFALPDLVGAVTDLVVAIVGHVMSSV